MACREDDLQETVWKEAVMDLLVIVSYCFAGETEENETP
jgi:hypothetical protein